MRYLVFIVLDYSFIVALFAPLIPSEVLFFFVFVTTVSLNIVSVMVEKNINMFIMLTLTCHTMIKVIK